MGQHSHRWFTWRRHAVDGRGRFPADREALSAGQLMDREGALRKVVALRKIRVDLGASPHESENAQRICERLMRQHGISADDIVRFNLGQQGIAPIDWTPWERVVQDAGLVLDRFGSRGQIRLPDEMAVFLTLRSGDLGSWRAVQRNRKVEGGSSVHSLGKFLSGRALKRQSLRSFESFPNRWRNAY